MTQTLHSLSPTSSLKKRHSLLTTWQIAHAESDYEKCEPILRFVAVFKGQSEHGVRYRSLL